MAIIFNIKQQWTLNCGHLQESFLWFGASASRNLIPQ